MREIKRRKCLEADNELERIWNENRREHKQLLTDAEEFIEKDETGQIKGLVNRVKNEEVDDDRLVDSVVTNIDAENYPIEAKLFDC